MEGTSVRRMKKITTCEMCDANCRSDFIETVNGVVYLSPRCRSHKEGARERQRERVRRYERAHGVNERVYSFIDKEGRVVTCKKAYWYRARKQGKIAEVQPVV